VRVSDVIEGRRTWSVECGDNLPWLQSLPTGCCSLAVTSPPYEAARTYGVGFKLRGQAWVDWMIPRVVEACRVVEGLVFVNMASQVRDGSCSPVIEWLVSDLTRHHGIVLGPAPYCYFRFGIPGSGGERYHRRDWEPVYALCRPEVLPLKWTDNKAMGAPPRWAPGGAMSNRLSDGSRVNQWGKTGTEAGVNGVAQRTRTGERQKAKRPSHRMRTKKAFDHGTDGSTKGDHDRLLGTAIANPGNVVREKYDAEEVRQILCGGEVNGTVAQGSPNGDVIRCLVGGGADGQEPAGERVRGPVQRGVADVPDSELRAARQHRARLPRRQRHDAGGRERNRPPGPSAAIFAPARSSYPGGGWVP
jgi:hypothetical protein